MEHLSIWAMCGSTILEGLEQSPAAARSDDPSHRRRRTIASPICFAARNAEARCAALTSVALIAYNLRFVCPAAMLLPLGTETGRWPVLLRFVAAMRCYG